MNANSAFTDTIEADTLPMCVRHRALLHGDRTAVAFLSDDCFVGRHAPVRLTYRELWNGACARAKMIEDALSGVDPAAHSACEDDSGRPPRVLLLYPPGVEFLLGFLAAQLAGCVPVPTAFPRPHREIPRLNSAARDCRPSLLLTERATLETIATDKLDSSIRSLPLVATDEAEADTTADVPFPWQQRPALRSPDSIAFLQYTSGSTSQPNGVVIRHRQLMSNLESIRHAFDLDWTRHDASDGDPNIHVAVIWLPFYHDMGLIGGILEPLYIGGQSVLFSPRSFLQRPIRWLQTISDYRASISGAPNFAYQLCVDRIPPDQTDSLSLADWKLAFCGAEPITPRTLIDFERRFSANGFNGNAFYPCYGLAEATLLVAGNRGPQGLDVISLDRSAYQAGRVEVLSPEAAVKTAKRNRQDLVACGSAVKDTEIAIVDVDSRTALPERQIGEIWIRGKGVADGYWSSSGDAEPDASRHQRFAARLADGREGFCRSGDLGFFHDGNLFVTGRVKELVILRGRNLYPQDIEQTVRHCIRDLVEQSGGGDTVTFGNAAAFSVPANRSEALAIVAELPRTGPELDVSNLVREIRRRIIDDHEVDPHHVWLVRIASIPVTTSGKTRRRSCRESFLSGSMRTLHRWSRATFSEQSPIPFPDLFERTSQPAADAMHAAIESWMTEWLIARAGVNPAEFRTDQPIGDYGLDSLTAVELSGETEDWTGIALTPDVAMENPSVAALSRYITDRYLVELRS